MTISLFLFVAAAVCFGLDALAIPRESRVRLTPLGLLLATVAFIIPNH